MIRESSSRPSVSTPSRCARDGPHGQPWITAFRSCSFGLCGAMTGAKIASRRKVPTSAKPAIAPGFRRNRYHASPHSPPLGPSSYETSAASISAMLIGLGSRVADPRVDERIREIDEQVHEHEY